MSIEGDNTPYEINVLEQLEAQTKLLQLIAKRLEAALETGVEAEDLE
jgi:hypothetical protein